RPWSSAPTPSRRGRCSTRSTTATGRCSWTGSPVPMRCASARSTCRRGNEPTAGPYAVRCGAPVAQLAEADGLKPLWCGFESHRGHQAGPTQETTMTTRLRGPMRTVLTHRATFGTGPDGAPLAYAVSQGTDSPLSVVDLAGRRLAGPSLPGSTGAWGLVGGPDGQCWIGSYYDGRSYHWDGHRVHDLGRPTPETRYTWDLALTEDGTVLFGTYPDAALVAHHPERGFVLLRRFGTDEVQYLRSLCWDPQRRIVWCAIGVTPNQVRGVFVDEPDREPLIVAGLDPTA